MALRSTLPAAAACGALLLTTGALDFTAARAPASETQRALRGSLALAEKAEASSSSSTSWALATGTAVAVAAGLTARRQRGRQSGVVAACRSSQIPRAAGGAAGGKKRVLVMGGTRFIGCYLVAKLRELGHSVVVLNRGKTNGGRPERLPGTSDAEYQKLLEDVTVLVADRKDPAALKAAVAGAGKFDVVFDNNVRKLAEVQPLVEGLEASGGVEQFIIMSSAGVYGPTDVLPLNEATPGDPNSRHKEKLECENFLAAKGLNWTSIRPVYIYGPLNYNPVEQYFFDRVARGRPVCVPGDGKFITQLGHCEDLATFMVGCIGNPAVRGQVYNLSGDEFVTFDGMVKVCAKAAGVDNPTIVHYDPKKVTIPEGFPKGFPFRGMHFFANIEKAKRDVPGWRPKYSLLEGLKDSYQRDFVARGTDKKEVDFRTDDLILQTVQK